MNAVPSVPSVDPVKRTMALAFDMASKLISTQDILKKYGLTGGELATIISSAGFKQYFREAKLAWDADPQARVRAKAAAAVEDGLLPVHTILHDIDANPTARLEAFKQLTSLAGLGPKKEEGGTAGRVNIQINVPSAGEPVVLFSEGDETFEDSDG